MLREYPTQQALRAGKIVLFEGVAFRATTDQAFPPGATYFGSRNTGPHLLTVARRVVEDNLVGGYIVAVENAYPFDKFECVQVEMLDAIPDGTDVVDVTPEPIENMTRTP